MNRRDAPALRVEGLDVVRDGLWILRDVALEIAPAQPDARLQRLHAGLEIDQQVGRRQKGAAWGRRWCAP